MGEPRTPVHFWRGVSVFLFTIIARGDLPGSPGRSPKLPILVVGPVQIRDCAAMTPIRSVNVSIAVMGYLFNLNFFAFSPVYCDASLMLLY